MDMASGVNHFQPNWAPLERHVGHNQVRLCSQFMWMCSVNGCEHYKHIGTREYLILDQTGKVMPQSTIRRVGR